MLGVYGSYHTWDNIDIWRTAFEFELYSGRLSLTGLAGVEGVEFPSTDGALLVVNQDDTHFFGHFDAAYYVTDDLRILGGYRYVSETHLGAAGIEYLLRGAGAPVSLFARGHFGDDEFNSVSGGVKIYFGSDGDKSLIERHRRDDPQNFVPVFPRLQTTAPPRRKKKQQKKKEKKKDEPVTCELSEDRYGLLVTSPSHGDCTCPEGSEFAGGPPQTMGMTQIDPPTLELGQNDDGPMDGETGYYCEFNPFD